MTLDEIRDALAEMDGWKYEENLDARAVVFFPWYRKSKDGGFVWSQDPHPPTLDGADAAMPKGVYWERAMAEWVAYATSVARDAIVMPFVRVPDTGNKIADLYALALACRRAMEAKR